MAEWKQTSQLDEALDEAYRRQRGTIRAVVARGGQQDSADLVQDAFLKTVEAGRSSDIGSPFAFLLRVARNSVIDFLRSRSRWAKVVSGMEESIDLPDPACDTERALIAAQRLQRALACIETMPPRRREVFLLHRVEGLTYVKIANRLGISSRTVEEHMSAAMMQLSREMDAHD